MPWAGTHPTLLSNSIARQGRGMLGINGPDLPAAIFIAYESGILFPPSGPVQASCLGWQGLPIFVLTVQPGVSTISVIPGHYSVERAG